MVIKRRYIIFAPPYLENDGGAIVLHKLCSILSDLDFDSYLYPYFPTFEIHKKNLIRPILSLIKYTIKNLFLPFKMNTKFNTKIFKGNFNNITEHDIVIYAESVFGNPLNAKNVVRWLLHKPGFHTNKIYYGQGELLYKFGTGNDNYRYFGSKLSDGYLKIIHCPLEYYNMDNVSNLRSGTAYCIRKGKYKKIQHDLTNSTLIDGKKNNFGLSHKEVSKIFKNVKTFISYDTYTAYSQFAALCGCISVVVPDNNVSKNEWKHREVDRYGLAYGFSDEEITHSIETANLLKEQILFEEKQNIENVKKFVAEVEIFFVNEGSIT